MLTAKPIWNCGFIGVRIYRHNLWLRRGDGGDCYCLRAIASDSSVDLRTAGVLFLIGLPSSDERST